jgi:protein-S-isoprenylcysteine O-methyltransferase Ste14
MAGRGASWVVAQTVVIAATVALIRASSRPNSAVLHDGGLVVALAGVLLFLWAYRTMGRSFTPFPRPLASAELVVSGPFRLVRHPVYGGLLLVLAGASLAFGLAGLVGTALLAALWWRKSVFEERLLVERYAGYATYRAHVRRRFLPFVG